MVDSSGQGQTPQKIPQVVSQNKQSQPHLIRDKTRVTCSCYPITVAPHVTPKIPAQKKPSDLDVSTTEKRASLGVVSPNGHENDGGQDQERREKEYRNAGVESLQRGGFLGLHGRLAHGTTLSQDRFADRGKEETKAGNDSDRSTANLPRESSYPNPSREYGPVKREAGQILGLA